MMEIEELKALQLQRGLQDVHLVHLAADGFTIAHTDDERASDTPLTDCDLHRWLHGLSEPPQVDELGVWVAVPTPPDSLQQDYDHDPWTFELLDDYANPEDDR